MRLPGTARGGALLRTPPHVSDGRTEASALVKRWTLADSLDSEVSADQ